MITLIVNYLLDGAVCSTYYNFIIYVLLNLLVLNLIICVASLNIIHSILFLILSFMCLSAIFFLLNLKFIGILIILIYAGALSILLLFVLMILDVKFFLFDIKISYKYFFMFFVFFLISFFFLIVFSNKHLVYYPLYIHIDYIKLFFMQDELVVLGNLLYNKNFFALLIVGIILLSVLIGSISMILNNKLNNAKLILNQLNIDKKKMHFHTKKKLKNNELYL